MGRLILILAVLAVLYLLWKAFGPQSWSSRQQPPGQERPIGPDDDPDFLWTLKKKEFEKKRREQRELERAQQELAAREARARREAQASASTGAAHATQNPHAGESAKAPSPAGDSTSNPASGSLSSTASESTSDSLSSTASESASSTPSARAGAQVDTTSDAVEPNANRGDNPSADPIELSTDSVDNSDCSQKPCQDDDNRTHGETA